MDFGFQHEGQNKIMSDVCIVRARSSEEACDVDSFETFQNIIPVQITVPNAALGNGSLAPLKNCLDMAISYSFLEVFNRHKCSMLQAPTITREQL